MKPDISSAMQTLTELDFEVQIYNIYIYITNLSGRRMRELSPSPMMFPLLSRSFTKYTPQNMADPWLAVIKAEIFCVPCISIDQLQSSLTILVVNAENNQKKLSNILYGRSRTRQFKAKRKSFFMKFMFTQNSIGQCGDTRTPDNRHRTPDNRRCWSREATGTSVNLNTGIGQKYFRSHRWPLLWPLL